MELERIEEFKAGLSPSSRVVKWYMSSHICKFWMDKYLCNKCCSLSWKRVKSNVFPEALDSYALYPMPLQKLEKWRKARKKQTLFIQCIKCLLTYPTYFKGKKLFIGTSVKSLEYRYSGAQQFFIQYSFLKSSDIWILCCFWAFLHQMVVKTVRLNNNSKSYSMFKTRLMFQYL